MSALHARVAPILAAQHALITNRQVLDAGGNREAIRRLVVRGVWERVDRGLYGPSGVPMTFRRKLMAAVLVGPSVTAASHRSAGSLLTVGGFAEPPVEVTILRGTSLRRPGVIVHESVDLTAADIVHVDGIPTTTPARLAMDLGSVVSRTRFIFAVREIQHRHDVSNRLLLATYLRLKQRGRNGGGALREWLDQYFEISGVSESALELDVLQMILDAGLPAPDRQHWVLAGTDRFRIDLAYPAVKLAIEVDGLQHKADAMARDDALRTEALVAAGWTVIRVRSWKLASDVLDMLDTIRNLVCTSRRV